MALSDRTQKVNFVISLKGMEDEGSKFEFKNLVYTALSSFNCPEFAFILHDLDTAEDGTLKTPHIHIYAKFQKVKRLGTFLNDLARALEINPLAISVEKCVSMESSVQYLIHKNDLEKYQYSMQEIVTNIPREELALLLDRPVEAFNVDFIIESWKASSNQAEFVKRIGLERYRLYRNVIQDLVKSL